jgi:hypothetical protein
MAGCKLKPSLEVKKGLNKVTFMQNALRNESKMKVILVACL